MTQTYGIEYDEAQFRDIKRLADELKSMHAQRDLDFQRYEDAYLMTWDKDTAGKMKRLGTKATMSPDARNQVVGAVRLLVSTEPVFNMVGADDTRTGKIEQAIARMWEQSGRAAGMPLHHDQMTSAVLYGEMHSAVTLTSDLVAAAEKAAGKAQGSDLDYAKAHLRKMEYLAVMTPVIIENWNPRTGYPLFDNYGQLTAYYRQSTIRYSDVTRRFGIKLSDADRRGPSATVTLHSFWDDVYTWYWIDGTVLYADKHDLPRIPINVQISDGTMLFDKPSEQRQPLLYGFIKSGMFDNQNLAYSIIYHLVFTMGATPIIKHQQNGSGKTAESIINYAIDGGAWELEPNEDIEYLQKNIIDPSLAQALDLATTKGQESTIYPQAFGSPVQGTDTYSTLALLSSSGRLPLIGPQTRGGWGISKTVELALMLIKEAGKGYKSNGIEIIPTEIPEQFQVNTKLEVNLPQDRLQMANLASMLVKGGMASIDWVQQNILQINDTAAMRKQIWKERAQEALYQASLQQNMQQIMQQQQPQPGGLPGQGTPTGMPQQPGAAGGIPPEILQQMQQGAGQGMPMTADPMMANPDQAAEMQGTPPAQAGMIPGAGEAVVPSRERQRNGRG